MAPDTHQSQLYRDHLASLLKEHFPAGTWNPKTVAYAWTKSFSYIELHLVVDGWVGPGALIEMAGKVRQHDLGQGNIIFRSRGRLSVLHSDDHAGGRDDDCWGEE